MKSQGEHVLIRRPEKPKATDGGLLLPDNYDKQYAYGRLVSKGSKCDQFMDDDCKEGSLVVYDMNGARDVELHPRQDAELQTLHGSGVFFTITEEELTERKLPIPK